VIHSRILAAAAFAAAGLFVLQVPASAQQQQEWFVPGQQRVPAAPRPTQQQSGPRQAPRQMAQPQGPGSFQAAPGDDQEQPLPQLQVELPPAPAVPSLPRGPAPPATVVGLISVPDVMHASTAAQAIERAIGERRQKLNEDAQKEQGAWRDLQQQLGAQRGSATPDQLRTRERELQERITSAQRKFRDRNRIIQEALQYSLAQIERTLGAVLQQVAASRGMNMVFHRAQVALNIPEFDVSQEVANQLNTILPSVIIPPDGVSPSQMPKIAAAPAAPVVAAPPALAPEAPAATAVPPAAATTPAAAPPAPATPPAAPAPHAADKKQKH
jgi:Skp family chaperone for outer membrane proteins